MKIAECSKERYPCWHHSELTAVILDVFPGLNLSHDKYTLLKGAILFFFFFFFSVFWTSNHAQLAECGGHE